MKKIPLPDFLKGPKPGNEVWEFQDHRRNLGRMEWGLRKSLPDLAWLPALGWVQREAEVEAERLAAARGNPFRNTRRIIPDNAWENEPQPSGPVMLSPEQLAELKVWAMRMSKAME
jgi:hypothetical protein